MNRSQYVLFRAILGLYLFAHFVQLIPWSTELFSNAGVVPDPSLSPLTRLFPNMFSIWDQPAFVTLILVGAAIGSLLLTLGRYDRWMAIGIWYIWACLFGRNPLIANPSLPYIGWLLLVHACIAPKRESETWVMPRSIFGCAWILMAISYTYSGYCKLASPSWIDGSALQRVLENPLARPTALREWILELPPILLQLATWTVLFSELAFAPLALSRAFRPILWIFMLGIHISLIVLLDFADLSIGMILFHLFTFDVQWLKSAQIARWPFVRIDYYWRSVSLKTPGSVVRSALS